MNSAAFPRRPYGRMLYQIIKHGGKHASLEDEDVDGMSDDLVSDEDTDESGDDLDTQGNHVFEAVCRTRRLQLALQPETDVRLLRWMELTDIYTGPDSTDIYTGPDSTDIYTGPDSTKFNQNNASNKVSGTPKVLKGTQTESQLENSVDKTDVVTATDVKSDYKLGEQKSKQTKQRSWSI